MQRIAQLIQANLNLRVFLPLLTLALAVTWYGMFWSTAHFSDLTDGLSFMDMQPALTADILFMQIRTYSEETVGYYLWWSLFDYAWPFVTFTTMLFINAWLLKFLAIKWQNRFWLLVASAYVTVLMDWCENAGFALLVLGLPNEPLWLAQTTLLLHAGKLFFMTIFNLASWILLAAAIVAGLKSRLGQTA